MERTRRFLRYGDQLVAATQYRKQSIYNTDSLKGNATGKALVPFQVLSFSVRQHRNARTTFLYAREKAKPLFQIKVAGKGRGRRKARLEEQEPKGLCRKVGNVFRRNDYIGFCAETPNGEAVNIGHCDQESAPRAQQVKAVGHEAVGISIVLQDVEKRNGCEAFGLQLDIFPRAFVDRCGNRGTGNGNGFGRRLQAAGLRPAACGRDLKKLPAATTKIKQWAAS
jgi:hypothetical protein